MYMACTLILLYVSIVKRNLANLANCVFPWGLRISVARLRPKTRFVTSQKCEVTTSIARLRELRGNARAAASKGLSCEHLRSNWLSDWLVSAYMYIVTYKPMYIAMYVVMYMNVRAEKPNVFEHVPDHVHGMYTAACVRHRVQPCSQRDLKCNLANLANDGRVTHRRPPYRRGLQAARWD